MVNLPPSSRRLVNLHHTCWRGTSTLTIQRSSSTLPAGGQIHPPRPAIIHHPCWRPTSRPPHLAVIFHPSCWSIKVPTTTDYSWLIKKLYQKLTTADCPLPKARCQGQRLLIPSGSNSSLSRLNPRRNVEARPFWRVNRFLNISNKLQKRKWRTSKTIMYL